jgi:hypothetical protein
MQAIVMSHLMSILSEIRMKLNFGSIQFASKIIEVLARWNDFFND